MLEGLEVSEVRLSEYKINNSTYRLDSEYFKRCYLHEDERRKLFENIEIGKFAFVTDGQHGYHEIDNDSLIHLLTAKNSKNWFSDLIDAEPLAKWVDDNNQRSSLQFRDILLTTRGTVGFCSIVPQEILPANIDQDIARIFIQYKEKIFPEYLVSYMNCIYGQDWIKRNQSGMVQQGLPLQRVREMPIPILEFCFQERVKSVIELAFNNSTQSKTLYTEAENILLEELGLNNWQPTIKNNNTKTLRESFLSSGRIDAEYYQPKYDEIEEKIINYKGGFDQVKNICNLKTQNFQPQDDVIYNYIELANIGSNGVIKDVTLNEGKDLPSRARRIVKTNDVIVSSVEGSLASCAIIPKEFNNAICSTGFYVINSKNINSETLLLLFKTAVIHLMEKGCSGTILTAINNEEFFKIPLPTIDENIQKTIADKIQQSFALQSKSKQLLEAAKKAVEMAIEQNEEMAMDYLKVIETNIEYATTKSTPSYAHFSELQ